MSRSSNNSLSDPSSSRSSGSLLLSNPVHIGEVNNTSNPHTRRLYRRSKHLDQRIRIVQCYLKLLCRVGYISNKNPSLGSVTINKTIPCYFFAWPPFCFVQRVKPMPPCSFLRPVRASLVLLHHVLRRSILSLPSRCTLAQCRLNSPLLVHRWHRRLDTTHILLPRGNLTLALRYRLLLDLLGQVPLSIFSLRCRVMWGLVTPTPLIRIKLVRLTIRW